MSSTIQQPRQTSAQKCIRSGCSKLGTIERTPPGDATRTYRICDEHAAAGEIDVTSWSSAVGADPERLVCGLTALPAHIPVKEVIGMRYKQTQLHVHLDFWSGGRRSFDNVGCASTSMQYPKEVIGMKVKPSQLLDIVSTNLKWPGGGARRRPAWVRAGLLIDLGGASAFEHKLAPPSRPSTRN